uniref:Uncharacterized protein n=1 Tax=Leptobrachium leishanense TaxID=445787 RepID=A0A8C5MKD0_9ANUR
MSQMQTFLAGEVAKLGTELRGEIDSLGARTAELEDQAAELTQAHNDLAEGTGDLAKRVLFLESKMEDLSNRSRRNNIRLRGLPETVSPKDLNGTVLGILRRLAPDIPEAQLLMDRIHRAQRPPNLSSLIPRDVIFRMHYFTAKHQILHAARTFHWSLRINPYSCSRIWIPQPSDDAGLGAPLQNTFLLTTSHTRGDFPFAYKCRWRPAGGPHSLLRACRLLGRSEVPTSGRFCRPWAPAFFLPSSTAALDSSWHHERGWLRMYLWPGGPFLLLLFPQNSPSLEGCCSGVQMVVGHHMLHTGGLCAVALRLFLFLFLLF